MDYKSYKCPTCGCEEIKEIGYQVNENDTYHEYLCLACGKRFNSNIICENNRAIEKFKNKILEQGNMIDFLKKEIECMNQESIDVYKENLNSVVEIYNVINNKQIVGGTGIILGEYILTNNHVLFPPNINSQDVKTKYYFCRFAKGKDVTELKLIKSDTVEDFAILKPEKNIGTPIKINCKEVIDGEKCYVMGNAKSQGISIVDGIISDKNRKLKGRNTPFIMFSAPVNHGNSGGPLFNRKGELIGLVTMGRTDAAGMNYAYGVKTINDFIKMIK